MASWSAFAVWNDIDWSGVTRTLRVGPRERRGKAFWSTGTAFGTWQPGSGGDQVGILEVIGGELPVAGLVLGDLTYRPPTEVLGAGSRWTVVSAHSR
jgi:hypothetical protein